MRAGIAIDRTTLQLYVHNLFDKRAELSTGLLNFGTTRAAISQPMTFGINLQTRF